MHQRKHVLFLIPSLGGGGAERVFAMLLKHLDREKFRISLGILNTKIAYFEDVPEDITIHDLRTPRVRYALPKLTWLIWKLRPDIVFSTLTDLNLILSLARPLLPTKTRYVARETIFLSAEMQNKPLSMAWVWAYRRFCRRLDAIVCQSLDMRDDLSANFLIPSDKLIVINNPLEIDKIIQLASSSAGIDFDADPNAVHLVAVGRLIPQKGFDLLIDAIAISGLKQLRAVVLGEGPLLEALEAHARSKGIGSQIRFIGYQKNPYAYMSRANAFVLCSRYEGFPNVLLEALACGAYVIATPAPGGVSEIARSTGKVQLASAVSAEALCVELERFVATRPASGNANLEQFSVGKIVEEYESVLLSNPLAPRRTWS